MKSEWVELGEVKVGEDVVIFRQALVVTKVKKDGGSVIVTGKTEDGREVVYKDYSDALVQRVVQDA